jgi:hypothetical protein
VEVDGKPLHLTGKEYGIMELLSLRKGTTLTKEMFLNHLYGGMDEPEVKIIDVFICKLRKKIQDQAGGDNYIETVWGRGYVLRDPEEGARPSKPPTLNNIRSAGFFLPFHRFMAIEYAHGDKGRQQAGARQSSADPDGSGQPFPCRLEPRCHRPDR